VKSIAKAKAKPEAKDAKDAKAAAKPDTDKPARAAKPAAAKGGRTKSVGG
jgi:hypothetical protein